MTDLTIQTSGDVPDSTYFTITSRGVEPELDGDVLTIYDGHGTRRSSWGAPSVTSTAVLHDADLVAVHVGFSHKHRGGQGWRYYRSVDGVWQPTTWARLTDEQRQRVLNGYETKAPGWAKSPGKLREAYAHPYATKQLRYKIVRVTEDGHYVSGIDSEVEYVLGKVLIQKARPDHEGGYYVCASTEQVVQRFERRRLFPEWVYAEGGTFALIECEVSGTCVEYDAIPADFRPGQAAEKEAWTYVRPLRVLRTIEYTPAQEMAHAI